MSEQVLRWPAGLHEIAGVVPSRRIAGCPTRRWAGHGRGADRPNVHFGVGEELRRPGHLGGPGDGDGLLERAEQLALLSEALAAVADSRRGRTMLAVGEAGIGKTALLRRFSDGVAGPARTLWAACDHLFVPRPLGPSLDLAEAAGGQLAYLNWPQG